MRNVVVLGMHRSGTSMVAGALASSGIYVGREDELLADQADNPHGFWERRDVVDLDERCLALSGGSWFRPPVSLATAPNLDEEFQAILSRMPTERSWLLKDPRMVLTWPLWQPLLADPVLVFVYRNPQAVAGSLQRRNGFPLTLGLALWEIYNQRALDAIQGHDVVTVAFESMLANPHEELFSLVRQLAARSVLCSAQPQLASVDTALGQSAGLTPGPSDILLSANQRHLALYCEALCKGDPLPTRPPLGVEPWASMQDLAAALAPLARVQETQLELEETTRLCAERTAERDDSLAHLRQLEHEHHALADAHREEVEQHRITVSRLPGLEQKLEALFVELSNSYGKLLTFEQSWLARVWRFIAGCYKLCSFRTGVNSGYDDILADARTHFLKHGLSLPEEQDIKEHKLPGKLTLMGNVMAYVMRNPAGSARSFSLPRLRRAAAVFMKSTPEDLGVWIDSRFPG